MLWFSVKVQITEEMASNLNKLLILPTVMLYTGIATAVIGLCLISIIVLLFFKKKRYVPATVRKFFNSIFHNSFLGQKKDILK